MELTTLSVPPGMLDSTVRFVRASRLPLEVIVGSGSAVQVSVADGPRGCGLSRLYVGGFIACETARAMAAGLGLRAGQMGKLLEFLNIKVRRCGLGCFK